MTQSRSRRSVIAGAAAWSATLALPTLAFGQAAFPDKSRPIKGIVPLSAGSTVDALARIYAQQMSEILGTNVVIDNRPGAEYVIGLQAVKSAPADGYTILFSSNSSQVVNPHLFKQLPYDPFKDFTALGATMKVPLVMITGPNFPFKSVKEVVAAAKAAPEKYSYGSVSSTTRLAGEIFAKAAGIKLLNVPYKSFTDFISDTLANRINFFFADGAALVPYVSQGMRGLAVTSKTRVARFPDIPTLQEEGFAVEIIGYHAAYVAAGTPPAILAVLRDALRKAEASKPVRDFIANSGNEVMNLHGEQFTAHEHSEYEKWGRAVKDAGMAGTL
jgi:tripartite-type tricarboxylate transporter receptor subunit TctC